LSSSGGRTWNLNPYMRCEMTGMWFTIGSERPVGEFGDDSGVKG
jgi:hypothetical protein